MRFEEILDKVGGFSRFQFLILFILCLPRFILPLHFLLHNFVSATPPHHCALESLQDGEVCCVWPPRRWPSRSPVRTTAP
ncbi:hypothetical protein CesoFtcFv8_008485 [Champsocephalus esox]|uniref:Uncharacterized protein n=1 Tax=Champsocephalus esox TaxID=159716 RepID=A0AAN8H1E2_9TELE|nr:hypothetical protein CesoFtcFv8_008485 [Champsocephalus esox]